MIRSYGTSARKSASGFLLKSRNRPRGGLWNRRPVFELKPRAHDAGSFARAPVQLDQLKAEQNCRAADQWNLPRRPAASQSPRSACIVSTRAARAAGTNDANTADTTTTAAAPINGIGPGS